MQGRFRGLDEQGIQQFQAWVDEEWARLLKKGRILEAA